MGKNSINFPFTLEDYDRSCVSNKVRPENLPIFMQEFVKSASSGFDKDPVGFVSAFIKKFVVDNPKNRLHLIDDSPMFDEPLVGIADGNDPLFARYKDIIGDYHWTPGEVLGDCLAKLTDVPPELDDISVICWALPIVKRTVESNARKINQPSYRWSYTRSYGEMLNCSLRYHLASTLIRMGHFAVAPELSPEHAIIAGFYDSTNTETVMVNPGSSWSERHALYAAGLGTFGLHAGLITERGTAMRCGSVVVNMKLTATPRPYNSPFEYCTFFRDRSCGLCIDRCPTGAIGINGHNKRICDNYGHGALAVLEQWYRLKPFGCALCMTGVPCSTRIPPKALKEKAES